MRIRVAVLAAAVLAASFASFARCAAELSAAGTAAADARVKSFVRTYCIECHGPEKQKGDLRFDQLNLVAAGADTLIDLQDMIDMMDTEEMPPKKAHHHPSSAEVQVSIDRLTQIVAAGNARLASTGARTVLRRINRREYLNTVGDLFGLNMTMFDPTTRFPGDQIAMHLDNVGDALQTSGYLLDQYLEAADQVVEKAFRELRRSPEHTWIFAGNFHQQDTLDRDQELEPVPFRYLTLYEATKSFKHNGAYGPIHDFAAGVPEDGFYEIKVKAEALNRHHRFDPALFPTMDPAAPFRLGIVPGDQKTGWLHYPQLIEPLLGETTLGDNGPEWHTFKVWLDAGHTPRFTFPNGLLNLIVAINQITRRHLLPAESNDGKAGIFALLPQIRIHEVRIRGPLCDQGPPAAQELIFGDKPFAADRTREILERFASRAYRRPARTDEVDRLERIVEQRRKDGRSPVDALKDGLKAVLCSPAFLYLAEPEPTGEIVPTGNRALSAYELAARLSYFLWSTMPDAQLTTLAQSGELLRPAVLLGQVRRLLASPKSNAFVEGFLDNWLNLRSLGDMPPAEGSSFDRYYADDLQNAMREETQLFARHLLDANESIVSFLDSDYAYLNRPLARLYGLGDAIDPVGGEQFRKVKLTDPRRGGLLGQASVLTVSANGIETSPVTRGVWILENILGTPTPPPPDNVPPLDPDVRGAKTMREVLTKHRENASCMECHRKIDPLGFALENFDPIGAWRSNYEKVEQVTPKRVRRTVGPVVDASGELPGGQAFVDVVGLKKILIARKDQFARTLTERVLGYACGRRIEPLDRPAVNAIVREVASRGYGFRDLIEIVALGKTFQSK